MFEELSTKELEERRAEARQIDRYWRVYCSLAEFRMSDLKVAQSTALLLMDIQKRLVRLRRLDTEIAKRFSAGSVD